MLTPTWEPLPPEPREVILARTLAELLPTSHLRGTPLNDDLSRQAFELYMEHLDASKLFLLQEHVDLLSAYADLMDDQLKAGDLLLARSGAALFVQRVAVIEKVVAAQLAKPFDFSRDESFETDRDKRRYAKTEQELADLWRRSLKLQVLERIERMEEVAKSLEEAKDLSPEAKASLEKSLKEIPEGLEAKEAKARKELSESYSGRFSRLGKLEPLEPAEQFLNAITAVYGPHTQYLAPSDKENFDISMSGSLEGIGAVLSEADHYIEVRELVPGGASWQQGELEAGDLILSVAQQNEDPVDVADMRINEVVRMIRGPRGTVVTLTVKKPDGRIEVIPIKRDVVEIEESYARGAVLQADGQPPMGYVQLQKFYGNMRARPGSTPERSASEDVRKLVAELAKRKVKGLVIDLRGNGGGLLAGAVDISGLFITTGPVVQTRRSDGEKEVLSDRDPALVFDQDLVVLVDRLSASASEILAAALQDYGRAVIVGTGPTHGKGTVQSVLDLSRAVPGQKAPLGVIKLTIQQFYGIDGESTQQRGVVPDVVLPDPFAHVELGERFLEHSMPWDSIDALKYTRWPTPPNLSALGQASQQRIKNVPEFAKLAKRGEFLEQRTKRTLVPLKRETWQQQRAADEKALKESDPGLDKAPSRFSVQPLADAPPDPEPQDSGRKDPRAARLKAWTESTARDPWIAESLNVLEDMSP